MVPEYIKSHIEEINQEVPHSVWSEFFKEDLTYSQARDLAYLYAKVIPVYQQGEYQLVIDILNLFKNDSVSP